MAHSPRFGLTMELETCHACGATENVLMASGQAKIPPTCVVCLMRLIDEPMEWRLSATAVQTLAQRTHAAGIRLEQEKIMSKLPPELQRKRG